MMFSPRKHKSLSVQTTYAEVPCKYGVTAISSWVVVLEAMLSVRRCGCQVTKVGRRCRSITQQALDSCQDIRHLPEVERAIT